MLARITFRNRLLLAFLLLLLLMLGIALSGYWFYQKRDQMGKFFDGLEQIGVEALQMIDYEKDFFMYDAVDSHFFKTHQSDYLSQHQQLLSEIQKDLRQLKQMSREVDYNIQPDLDTILQAVQQNESVFSQSVNLIKQRGYRDYGLEGKMREFAHLLENNPLIAQADLLTLRRREKDYLLRKDTVYVDMFDKLASQVLTKLAASPQTEAVRNTRQDLRDYQNTFKSLVLTEQLIGTDNFSGMRSKMRIESQLIRQKIRVTMDKTEKEFATLLQKLELTFALIILSALLLGGGLSYFLTRQLVKPIGRLSQQMDTFIKEGFASQKKPEPLPIIAQDEIGDLTRSFNVMTERIHRDWLDIHEKSTALKYQNSELQIINFKLTASQNRLQSVNQVKDKFLSIISHDVRGPLNTLTGFLDMLRHNANDFSPEEMSEFADKMNVSVRRVLSLMENLLQWSRSQTGDILPKAVSFPLLPVLEDNLNLLRETANRKNVRLSLEVEKEILVQSDKNMLDFVLRNLISNGIKFTPAGGQVTVKVNAGLRFSTLSVIDTGVGIKAEDVEKIFNPDTNFSTPGTDKELGTGFGLILCKDFIEKNGGELLIESIPTKGTSVSFTVPVLRQKTEIPVVSLEI